MKKGSEIIRDILAEIGNSKNVQSIHLGEMLGVEKSATRQAKIAKFHRYLKRLAEDVDDLQKICVVLKKPASFFLFSSQKEISEEFESLVLSRLERIDQHLSAIYHVVGEGGRNLPTRGAHESIQNPKHPEKSQCPENII